MRNILRLLAPGGLFITAGLRRCRSYHVGPHRFACADIDEHDLAGVLFESGVEARNLQIEVHPVGLGERLGYDSILLAAATVPAPEGERTVTDSADARPQPGTQWDIEPDRSPA